MQVMRAIIALLLKEVHEHGFTLLMLTFGFLCSISLGLLSNQSATFSLSPLEVVRFSLLWILPLVAFIVGNLLVVREYLSRTRLFVEALPLSNFLPFAVKFVFGYVYLALLALLCVAIAAIAARTTDLIDQRFVTLIVLKTLALVLLIWSIVYTLSFCGKLRVALYFIFLGLVLVVVINPGIDHLRLGPFALFDAQLFAFERAIIPWRELIETLILAAVFLLVAWLLVSLNEGSVAEMLAKPLSRRDYVALGILSVGGLTMIATLSEKWRQPPDVFVGGQVVSSVDPPVSVRYTAGHRLLSQNLLARLVPGLDALQVQLRIPVLPQVRVSLDPSLQPEDIDFRGVSGVLVTANFVDLDNYQRARLYSVVLHQVMQIVTNGRTQYEPIHWLVDGVSRWWAEHRITRLPQADTGADSHSELLARAVHAERRMTLTADLSREWQRLAEMEGYVSTEALAYSMVVYLVEELGEDTLLLLARRFLARRAGNSSLETIKSLLNPFTREFAAITGVTWSRFHRNWRRWLQDRALIPQIASLLTKLPQLSGHVEVVDATGAPRLQARYERIDDGAQELAGECLLRHRPLPPFDSEVVMRFAERDSSRCETDGIAHDIVGEYGFGDRVMVVLEYKSAAFHEPIRVLGTRVTIE